MQKLSGLAIALSVVLLAGSMAASAYALPSVSLSGKHGTGQHVENEGTAKVDSVKVFVKNKKKQNDIAVQLVKDGSVVATASVSASDLSKKVTQITADFGGIELTGDYDIVVSGDKGTKLLKEKSASGSLFAKNDYGRWDLKYEINDEKDPDQVSQTGSITVYAHRIASEHWSPTFTDAGAKMYFVLYNSAGDIVWTGFSDESGQQVTGLKAGEQYYVYPTDCNSCHESDHDVVFDHWQDGSAERPRAVKAGESASAYYRFVPHAQ